MNCLTFSLARKLVNLFRNLNKFKHKRNIKSFMEKFAMYLTCTDFLKVLLLLNHKLQCYCYIIIHVELWGHQGLPVMSELDINCAVSVCVVGKPMAKH